MYVDLTQSHFDHIDSFFENLKNDNIDYIEHTINYALSGNQESLELKKYYFDLLTSTDLANYFKNLKDFISFVKDYTPPEYKNSDMFIQSLNIMINQECVDRDNIPDENFLKELIGDNSLVHFSGMRYPEDTCPYIDNGIEVLNEEKKEIEADIENLKDRIDNLEKEENYDSDLYTDYKIDIKDLDEKIERIEEDLVSAENLRLSCSAMRNHMKNISSVYNQSISLYSINFKINYKIIKIENYNSDRDNDDLIKLEEEFNFNNSFLFDKALNNHELIRSSCNNFSIKLENLHEEIFSHDPTIISRDNFIKKMIDFIN